MEVLSTAGSAPSHWPDLKSATDVQIGLKHLERKAFGLSVKEDNPDVQPLSFHHSCYNMLVRSQKAKEENRVYTPTVQLFAWSAHTEDSCVCV